MFTVLVKYLLHCIDLYDENPWENKAVYLLYLELVTSKSLFVYHISSLPGVSVLQDKSGLVIIVLLPDLS